MSPRPRNAFVSLGMFIIDTIITPTGETLTDIIGGAGTFAAIAARMFTSPLETGFIVDYGSDTPDFVENTINSFQFAAEIRRDHTRKCTRGLNTYVDGVRMFEYLTPKIRITGGQLPPAFLASASFHLICGPQRCLEIVEELNALRRASGSSEELITVWEPVPDSCIPEDRALFEQAAKVVDVLSPNRDEAAGILDYGALPKDDNLVERMAKELIKAGARTVIIRCAENGAYLADATTTGWFPAYYQDSSFVVDATGGGNAFCGAIAVSLGQRLTIREAISRAAVAAAVAISQIGVPELVTLEDDSELWNGKEAHEMVLEYQKSISSYDRTVR